MVLFVTLQFAYMQILYISFISQTSLPRIPWPCAVDCITLSQASYFKQREEQFKSRLLQKHEISLLPELRRRVGEKPDAVQTTPDVRI